MSDSIEHQYYKWKVVSLIGDIHTSNSQVHMPPQQVFLGKRAVIKPLEYEIPDLDMEDEDWSGPQSFFKRPRLGFQRVPAAIFEQSFALLDMLTEAVVFD